MIKMFKILLFFSSSLLIGFNCLLLTSCYLGPHFNREDYVSMLRYNIPDEHNFILKYENMIIKPARVESINSFNNLLINPRWKCYQALQNDLNNTVIGHNKIDVNWTKMYDTIGLNKSQKQQAQNEQLQFYNIMDKLYGSALEFNNQTVMTLVQTITFANLNKNTISQTVYNIDHNNLRMQYDKNFANIDLIQEQYELGWWSTNNITTVSIQEYGNVFSLFLSLNSAKRKTFNHDWNWDNKDPDKDLPSFDPSIYLMNFLDKQIEINDNSIIKPLERTIFPLIIVRSNYGRDTWLNNKKNDPDELFSQAFAEWLLTPNNIRNWNWELLNDFFINELPNLLKTTNDSKI